MAQYKINHQQLQQYRELFAYIDDLLMQSKGGRVDPAHIIRALNSQLRQTYLPRRLPLRKSANPDDYLFLTLPSTKLEEGIEELDLSLRIYQSLRKAGIRTLGDLLEYSATDLLAVRGIGPKMLLAVEAKLSDRGLHLSRHDQGLKPPPGDSWIALKRRTVLYSRLYTLSVMTLVGPEEIGNKYWTVLWYLARFGVDTVGQLLDLSREEVMSFRWKGKRERWHSRISLTPESAVRYVLEVLGRHRLVLRYS